MSLSESAACHVKCEWGKKKDKSRLITIVTKRKTVSVSIHQENHSNTRLRPGVLSTSNSVTNTDLKGPQFITNAYRDATRNSDPRPSSRPHKNLRAVAPSVDEARCAGAEGQESDDPRKLGHCFGKGQRLNNLLDKSKQILKLIETAQIDDRV